MSKHLANFTNTINALIKRYPKTTFVLFALIIARAAYLSFGTATLGEWASLDMQWYPTKQLFGLGEFEQALNPYIAYLNGDVFLANGPNYMPLMYYVMFPFGLLEWEGAKIAFALCNIALFCGVIALFMRYGINRGFVYGAAILAVLGYCFGNVIGNAQSAIMIGFFIALAYCFRHKPIILSIALAFVCIKHSFGLPLLLGFFLAGYKREVIAAGVLVALVVCAFSLQTHTSPIDTLRLLSQVNAAHYASGSALGGPSDLFSLSQKLFHNPISPISFIILAIYASFVWIVYAYKPEQGAIISASIVLALFTLPHLGYDSYMLLLALLIAKDSYKASSLPMLALLALTLFIYRGQTLKPYIDSISQAIMQLLNGGGAAHNTRNPLGYEYGRAILYRYVCGICPCVLPTLTPHTQKLAAHKARI